MSQLAIFTQLKTTLSAISGIKHVALWNNQYANESQENAFLYPCVFIQFTPTEFRDLTKKVQQQDCTVTLHIGFESYKDEDTDILTLKQTIYAAIHGLQIGLDNSKLLRVDERQNFDHSNIQDYEIDFKTTIKDADAITIGTTHLAGLDLTGTII